MKNTQDYELYTDGGTVGPNPSPLGGAWAWCLIRKGKLKKQASGLITPEDIGLPTVSNNVAELYAAVRGVEYLIGKGFTGRLHTDSGITWYRMTDSRAFNGCPDWLKERALSCQKERKFFYDCAPLLGGHPSKEELRQGFRKDGKPVSQWNVLCDKLCSEVAERHRAA